MNISLGSQAFGPSLAPAVAARGNFMAPGVKDHIRRPLETSDSSETVSVARFVKRGKTACASPTLLPARRYASAGLCDSDVSVRLSVRPSVCHTPVLCLAERKQDREMYTV